MKINFVDLKLQYLALKDEFDQAISQVFRRGDFILGEDVTNFEKEFASFIGVKYAVGVDSGIDALFLALHSFEIGPGDEVITAANTFISTAFAITHVGAKVVLIDIDPKTYNVDVSEVEKRISPRTKAIIPVHLYGQPADMDPILSLAKRYNLKVIEDACQAHGSYYKGKRVGGLGDIGCFSFYPAKNLGAYGDGGMVVTDNEEIAEKIRMLSNLGQKVKYHHLYKGFNNRLDTIQAAILRVKLRYIDGWNQKRRENAQLYTQLLSRNTPYIPPYESPFSKHVYHLFVIRSKNRDELRKYLSPEGIATGIHYPIPIHLSEAYVDLKYKLGDFPVTEQCAKEIISLPMYPELKQEEITYVVDRLKKFANKKAGE